MWERARPTVPLGIKIPAPDGSQVLRVDPVSEGFPRDQEPCKLHTPFVDLRHGDKVLDDHNQHIRVLRQSPYETVQLSRKAPD